MSRDRETLLIVGVGLIGGSLGLGLRAAGYCGEIVGSGSREHNLRAALEGGAIDRYVVDPSVAAREADIVLLAVPMGAMREVMRSVAPALARRAIITDAGSVKGSFVADARAVFADSLDRVVPGHPIAGSENSGVAAARADLFARRRVILTPLSETAASAIERVQTLWHQCGAVVHRLGVEAHDAVLAATSHLPHLLSFALVERFDGRDNRDDIFRFAAGGFRDFTRIAASDPVMWRDVMLANRAAVLAEIDDFSAALALLRKQVAVGDGDAMAASFGRARVARRDWAELAGAVPTMNATAKPASRRGNDDE